MLFDLLLFPLFLMATVSLGACLNRVLTAVLRLEDNLNEDLSVDGLLGLLFLGMAGVLVNFFLPLASLMYLCSMGLAVLVGIVLLIKRGIVIDWELLALFVAAVLLVPAISDMKAGYDAGLYHLPHQLWLRTEPIVVGLANLHARFGFSSLYEYIGAPLWVNERFRLLAYTQASFLVFFVGFLVSLVRFAQYFAKEPE